MPGNDLGSANAAAARAANAVNSGGFTINPGDNPFMVVEEVFEQLSETQQTLLLQMADSLKQQNDKAQKLADEAAWVNSIATGIKQGKHWNPKPGTQEYEELKQLIAYLQDLGVTFNSKNNKVNDNTQVDAETWLAQHKQKDGSYKFSSPEAFLLKDTISNKGTAASDFSSQLQVKLNQAVQALSNDKSLQSSLISKLYSLLGKITDATAR